MDIATRNNILEFLPSELIAKILAMLDYRDLASCTQVRVLLSELVPRSSTQVPLVVPSADRYANTFSI